MKILHIGHSDTNGGASIAMMRVHRALLEKNIDSNVLVSEKLSDDRNVFSFNTSLIDNKISNFKIKLARQKKYIFNPGNRYSHSLNIFNSRIFYSLNQMHH